jgi:hypothetical protein
MMTKDKSFFRKPKTENRQPTMGKIIPNLSSFLSAFGSRFSVLGLLCLSALVPSLFSSCGSFNKSFDNVEEGWITRPLCITLDPPEAAPGDTVAATLLLYSPDPAQVGTHWKMALDYALTGYGTAAEKSVIDLSARLLHHSTTYTPGGIVKDSIRFVVPESTLVVASAVPGQFPLSPDAATLLGLPPGQSTIAKADLNTALSALPLDLSLLPPDVSLPLQLSIDMFGCPVRLRAVVSCENPLEVTRTLGVRYSRRFNSSNANTNPLITAISIIRAYRLPGLDLNFDLDAVPHDTLYLFHAADPAREVDTVTIDTGCAYFTSYTHDSMNYIYLSGDDQIKTAGEGYFDTWLVTNLDPSSLPQDSLLMTGGSRLLPPVDVNMHRFRLYLLVRDDRPEWGGFFGGGTSCQIVEGYFKYTGAYQRKMR